MSLANVILKEKIHDYENALETYKKQLKSRQEDVKAYTEAIDLAERNIKELKETVNDYH